MIRCLLRLCAIPVVKADCVQGGAAMNYVRMEINISVATFLLECIFGKMILPHLKSSIPAGPAS